MEEEKGTQHCVKMIEDDLERASSLPAVTQMPHKSHKSKSAILEMLLPAHNACVCVCVCVSNVTSVRRSVHACTCPLDNEMPHKPHPASLGKASQ